MALNKWLCGRLVVRVLVLWSLTWSALAAPEADLWPMWEEHSPDSSVHVSHELWQWFLDHFVVTHDSGVNRIDYAMVDALALQKLQNYIDQLSSIDPAKLNRNQQFAYWVNLYNAVTVTIIAAAYPVKSILDTGDGWFRRGPWRDKILSIQQQAVSLDDIEHRILRPIWRDYRIHFVVNCASIGCPNLLKQAISPFDLESQLNQATRAFLSHPRGFSINDDILYLSSIFAWYAGDFGKNQQQLLSTIAPYLSPQQANQIRQHKRIRYRYDWALNDLD